MSAIWFLIPLPFLKPAWTSGSSQFTYCLLLKPGLENFEHYFTSMWDEYNCAVVWAFFDIAFLWYWNENWPFEDRQVMVERSDRMWSTGEGNGKPIQYSCLENPMNSMKRQKDRTLKDELPRLVGTQYATGEEWINNSRKNEETEPKWKHHPGVDVTVVMEVKSDAAKSNIA